MVSRDPRSADARSEHGQAALLMLGLLATLAGTLVLFGFGQALGARGHAQRAADLAAISAAQVMRRNFPRLFEPPLLETGLTNPRHLSNDAYLSLARAAALRGARRNGVAPRRVQVEFRDAGFAPTRVTVALHHEADGTTGTRASTHPRRARWVLPSRQSGRSRARANRPGRSRP
jgi:hypothetical protein